MAAYKRDGVWRYRKRLTLPDGRRTRIEGTPAINTKAAAEAAERAHLERVLDPPKPAIERRKLSDVLDRFLTDYVTIANNKESEKASKRTAIERYLKPELGSLFLDEIKPAHIAELAAKLHRMEKSRGEGTLGAKSVKNILQTLRKCLRWAEDMEWLEKAPKMKMPRVDEDEIRFLEDVELAALLQVAEAEPLWFAAAVLAADAGLRLGELRALRWTDYNEVTGKLVLSRSRWRNIEAGTKSRKPRTVAVTKRLKAALHAIRGTKLRGPYVLSKADGNPYGAEHMFETMERLARTAKLTECGWHTLRHTFITRLAMRGAPARTIQEIAGHASIATTMRYMHVVKGAADAAIALLDEPSASWAKGGRETEQPTNLDAEAGEILPFVLVTPSGLESK